MVVLPREFNHPPGMLHRGGDIAANEGDTGVVHGHQARQALKIFFIGVHRLPVHVLTQPPFGVPQAGLNACQLTVL